MYLLEFEAKGIVREIGVRIPRGFTFKSAEELSGRLRELKFPVMLKAQVPILNRASKGGVKKVNSEKEALKEAKRMFLSQFDGFKPKLILMEEYIPHKRELYLSLAVSPPKKRIIAIISKRGGAGIESSSKEMITIEEVDPIIGLKEFQCVALANKLELPQGLKFKAASILRKMYSLMVKRDLKLIEINPLAISKDGDLYALDVKVDVDEDALFRQEVGYKSLQLYKTKEDEIAEEYGFFYVPLEGDIAVIGNGAGLVMATLDLLSYYGGKPSCFIDIGGGASSERVSKAIEVALSAKPRALLINIFAGITRCDEVAKGISEAVKRLGVPPSMMIVRLTGTKEIEGGRILEKIGINFLLDMEKAVLKAVSLTKDDTHK